MWLVVFPLSSLLTAVRWVHTAGHPWSHWGWSHWAMKQAPCYRRQINCLRKLICAVTAPQRKKCASFKTKKFCYALFQKPTTSANHNFVLCSKPWWEPRIIKNSGLSPWSILKVGGYYWENLANKREIWVYNSSFDGLFYNYFWAFLLKKQAISCWTSFESLFNIRSSAVGRFILIHSMG